MAYGEVAGHSNTFFIDQHDRNKLKERQRRTKGKNYDHLSRHDLIRLVPKTEIQYRAIEAMKESDVTVLHGSAGTGKTFLAMHHALNAILDPESPYTKIVIIRSIVSCREIGFLPGTLEEKIGVYEDPYISLTTEITGHPTAYEKFKEQGKIEFVPTSFLRGVTFNNAIVILDESQNCNFAEFSTIMTRIADGTKLLICGDGVQTDLNQKASDKTGFYDAMRVLSKISCVKAVEFEPDDIVRGGFMKEWIIQKEKLGL